MNSVNDRPASPGAGKAACTISMRLAKLEATGFATFSFELSDDDTALKRSRFTASQPQPRPTSLHHGGFTDPARATPMSLPVRSTLIGKARRSNGEFDCPAAPGVPSKNFRFLTTRSRLARVRQNRVAHRFFGSSGRIAERPLRSPAFAVGRSP